jgi:hypothetical protein
VFDYIRKSERYMIVQWIHLKECFNKSTSIQSLYCYQCYQCSLLFLLSF